MQKAGFKIIIIPAHCKQDPIYVFPEMKLRGLVPNFYIHVSVSDLYIPLFIQFVKNKVWILEVNKNF
jgi:hypothetical protein